ncbi:hypothetical protein ACFLR8_04155 [Bacteroidota bacterium]
MHKIMIHNTTKSILLTFIVFFSLSHSANAQFSRFGGGLSFSTGIENEDHKTGNPGISARAVIELGDKFWLIPGFSFYMPGKRQHNTYGLATTLFGSLDADFTYTLGSESSLLFYALAGANLSYLSTKFKSGDAASNMMPALNIGTGIEMIVEKDLNGFAQIKGVIGSYEKYLAISLGVHYYINGRRYKSW